MPSGELVAIRNNLTNQINSVERLLVLAQTLPCRVRPDWTRPVPPEGDYQLAVIFDDGWYPHWSSETEDIDYVAIEGPDSWPFVEQTAYGDDWKRLGFIVI